MADVLFGVDLSHHKPGFDFGRARREGITFALLKASEGDSMSDATFTPYLTASRKAGLLTAAYHYQRADAAVSAQVRRVTSMVPRDVPVAVDVEANSGSVALTRQLIGALKLAGYRVPWVYLPRWYWQQIGSPSLAGLPPLWSSRYPSMSVASATATYRSVPESYWSGYGGLNVELLQYTSSAAVANYTAGSIDVSAFRGSLAQLTARFGTKGGTSPSGSSAPSAPTSHPSPSATEDDEMILAPAGTDEHVDLIVTGRTELYLACSWGQSVDVSHILFYGATGKDPKGTGVGGGYDAASHAGKPWTFKPNQPGPIPIPKGAKMATVRYTAKHSFGLGTA
jgi:lysozyme